MIVKIYLGWELSEAKLYVIKTKVDAPPEMLFIGMLTASQTPHTHLFQEDSSEQSDHHTHKSSSHEECNERFSSEFITQTSDVEGEKNWDKVFTDFFCPIEVDNLDKVTKNWGALKSLDCTSFSTSL